MFNRVKDPWNYSVTLNPINKSQHGPVTTLYSMFIFYIRDFEILILHNTCPCPPIETVSNIVVVCILIW